MLNTKKLDSDNIEDILSLTSTQEGMLYHYVLDNDSGLYLEQLSIRLIGEYNESVFDNTWKLIIESNEMLRTTFRWEKLKAPVQIVLKTSQLAKQYEDISLLSKNEKDMALEAIKLRDREKGFNLTEVPFRITLCKIDRFEYEMIISNHHILFDGWSTTIILKEFITNYNGLMQLKHIDIVKKNKFKEFIKWHKQQDKEILHAYWKDYLKGINAVKAFIPDFKNPGKVNSVSKERITLSEDLLEKLSYFTNEHKITLANIFNGAWGILIYKYTNNEDVVFGTVTSGRNFKIIGIQDMVGLFINTIPLYMKLNDSSSLYSILSHVCKSQMERVEHENAPLSDILMYAGIKKDEDLFDSIVVIENYPIDNILTRNNESMNIDSYTIYEKTSYSIVLEVKNLNGIELSITYNDIEFNVSTIQRLLKYYIRILEQLVNDPFKSIANVECMDALEKKELVYEFNNTIAEYPKDIVINRLFEKQVENIPDNTALIDKNRSMTYKELNEKSNQLARLLKAKGVCNDTVVGIMLEPACEMIVGIMAVLKAGGAYVPIDIKYPKERINFMLNDSKAVLLLSGRKINISLEFEGEILYLDDESLYSGIDSNLITASNSGDLAYIIYTSGSTGKPKGVMITQRGLVNYVWWAKNTYLQNKPLDFPLYSSISFDLTVTSIYTPLISGGKIFIYNNENGIEAIQQIMKEDKVQIIKMTPTHLKVIEELDFNTSNVKKLIVGGEDLKAIQASKIYGRFSGDIEIYNEYGPTETVVGCMVYKFDPEKNNRDSVPIGKPADNVQIYILDKYLMPTIVGGIGEIYISGDGVARGYMNLREQTEERFIANPFVKGQRMYKSGDLARWLPDGNIEYIGRADQQIKIRGFRIELGEIEGQLIREPYIKEAIVVAKEQADKEKCLCAYIVAEYQINLLSLKDKLTKQLPSYMIPAYLIQVDKIPVNQNGKTDINALLAIEGCIESYKTYEAPTNEIEKALVCIWRDLLNIDRIGINDNFFEIGGNSLKVLSLVTRMHKAFDTVISISEIFNLPTIKEVANYIVDAKKQSYRAILKAPTAKYYNVSPAQKRMFILHKLSKNTGYNMPGAFIIEGNISKDHINNIFKSLIERHESLRTSFTLVDGEPVQMIHEHVDFEIDFIKDNENKIDYIINEFISLFDLSQAPLLRVKLVELDIKKHLLLFDIHHIIADGISIEIFMKEFISQFNKFESLPAIDIQYKDYTVWLKNNQDNLNIKKQEKYWLDTFCDKVPMLNLPTDFARPSLQGFQGDKIRFKLGKALTEKLMKIAIDTESTLYMVLMSIYAILISKYCSQNDIIIGFPVAGRPHAELEGVMGMFVNMLALRNKINNNDTFNNFLMNTRENMLKALENQDYQFDELVEKLKVNRDSSRNPLFDVAFALQNYQINEFNLDDISIKPYEIQNTSAKCDITLNSAIADNEVDFLLEYSKLLFSKETMMRFTQHYINIASEVADNWRVKIGEIKMLSPEEKNQLLSKVKFQLSKGNIEKVEGAKEKLAMEAEFDF